MKLILKDKKEIPIIQYTVPLTVTAACQSPSAVTTLWKKLTPEQLSEISIVDDNEVVIGSYVNAAVTNVQSVVNVDGETITAHFYLSAEPVDLAEKAAAYDILAGEAE